MPIKVILSTAIGIVIGRLFLTIEVIESLSFEIHLGLLSLTLEDILLGMILFIVGLELSKQTGLMAKIKKIGVKVLLVPVTIVITSIVAGVIAGLILNMPLNEAIAVSSGLGWYSFTAVELGKYSAALGATALLVNVGRELAVFIFGRYFKKYGTDLGPIGVAGCTGGDVTQPAIIMLSGEVYGMIAFITGIILGFVVPIIVPFFYNL